MRYAMKIASACVTCVLCLGVPPSAEVRAIDYDLRWNFDEPIGSQSPPETYSRDFLVYDVRTGSLVYEVGEQPGLRWAPPDVVSASGTLRTTQPLEPVPLASFDPPDFEFNETIGGKLVEGSNSIRIRYDGLRYWPLSPSHPSILELWGLKSLPTSYEYGEILPAGLSQDFVLMDLYAATATINRSYVELVYVVPEPYSMCLCALAILPVIFLARPR